MSEQIHEKYSEQEVRSLYHKLISRLGLDLLHASRLAQACGVWVRGGFASEVNLRYLISLAVEKGAIEDERRAEALDLAQRIVRGE